MSSSGSPSPRATRSDSAGVPPVSTSTITSTTTATANTASNTTRSDQAPQRTTVLEPGSNANMSSASVLAHERPRLPPIMSIDDFHRGLHQPPLHSPGLGTGLYSNLPHNTSPVSNPLRAAPDHFGNRPRRDDAFHPVRSPFESTNSTWQPHNPPQGSESHSAPQKRSYGAMSHWPPERYTQAYPSSLDSPTHMEQPQRPMYPNLPPSSRSSLSEHMTSTRTHSFAATNITDYSSVHPSRSNTHRCSLHIRQQPRAARAGPDGKDRRAIDPPPVLQLMINDFDPTSDDDMNELRSSYFVVHCRLVSAHSPKRDMSTLSSTNDDGSTEVQRLLLGTSVASPFFCADDPDLVSMPTHPRGNSTASDQGPPSPTSRFIMPRSAADTPKKLAATSEPSAGLPGTFFIFADLSIRRAGEYRLEFCLMKVEPSTMVAGSKLPILHSITSHVFRVVNAKDFDQVQPSTDLVKGLLDRGAGFPLKLKKGTREGGRRRNATDSEGGGESIGGGDGEEEDDDDEDD